jgi:hypothetical protein
MSEREDEGNFVLDRIEALPLTLDYSLKGAGWRKSP